MVATISCISIDLRFLNEKPNQNIMDISVLLADAKIPYEIIQYHGWVALKTQSGVIVDFEEEKKNTV